MKMRTFFKTSIIALALILIGAGGRSYMDSAVVDTYIDIKGSSAPAASAAGQSRIYVDSTQNLPMISTNGSNFQSLKENKNVIINGDFRVDQRGFAGLFASNTSQYTFDRWNTIFAISNSGLYTAGTATTLPITNNSRAYSGYKLTCGVVNTSVSAGTQLLLRTSIESQTIPPSFTYSSGCTLSFWVKSFQTGQFGVSLQNPTSGKAAVQTFTVNNSATWEYKSVSFGAMGILNTSNSNNAGLELDFCLICGSTFQTGSPSTTFSAGQLGFYTTSSQVNFGSSTNNSFELTGVQLEEGSLPTYFEFRPYQQELAMCQRYCYTIANPGNTSLLVQGGNSSNSLIYGTFYHPVTMRVAPTFTLSGTTSNIWSQAYAAGAGNAACTSITQAYTTANQISLNFNNTGATWSAGNIPQFVYWQNGAANATYLIFNADY